MLFGAMGQCITMILLAVLGSVQGTGAQVTSAVLLFVFNSFFAIGWLGMAWLYVSCLLAVIYTKFTCSCVSVPKSSGWKFVHLPMPLAHVSGFFFYPHWGSDTLLHSFELDIQFRSRDGHWPVVQQYILGHLHR